MSPGPDTTRQAPGLERYSRTTCRIHRDKLQQMFHLFGVLPASEISNSRGCVACLFCGRTHCMLSVFIVLSMPQSVVQTEGASEQESHRLLVAHSHVFDPCSLCGHGYFNNRNPNDPKHVLDFLQEHRFSN